MGGVGCGPSSMGYGPGPVSYSQLALPTLWRVLNSVGPGLLQKKKEQPAQGDTYPVENETR